MSEHSETNQSKSSTNLSEKLIKFMEGFSEEWNYLLQLLQQDSSQHQKIQPHQIINNESISGQRKQLFQLIEKIKIQIDEKWQIIENLKLVSAEYHHIQDEISELIDAGKLATEQLFKIDQFVKKNQSKENSQIDKSTLNN